MKKLLIYIFTCLIALVICSFTNPTVKKEYIKKDSITNITVDVKSTVVTVLDTNTNVAINKLLISSNELMNVRAELVKEAMRQEALEKDLVIRKVCNIYNITEADLMKIFNTDKSVKFYTKWIIIISLMSMMIFVLTLSYKQKWKLDYIVFNMIISGVIITIIIIAFSVFYKWYLLKGYPYDSIFNTLNFYI